MVKRALKWLLPALVVAQILLVWANLLSLHDAVLVVVEIETLLLLVGARQLFAATRRYRRGRRKRPQASRLPRPFFRVGN
jgi:hypothetical protein